MKKLVLLFLLVATMSNAQEYDFLYDQSIYNIDIGLLEIVEVNYYDANGLFKARSQTTVDLLGNYRTIYYDEYYFPIGSSEVIRYGRVPKLRGLFEDQLKIHK